MASSIPLQIAETIQTASINRAPSPSHDLNPSTAASKKEPVTVSGIKPRSESSFEKFSFDDVDGIDAEDEEDDIPYSVIRPKPRRGSFPPLPDLRFEQSYLASIAEAKTRWRVAYITIRDQVFLPLVQGMVWSLALHGWRYWNRSAQLSGSSVGARVRRWWYKTNNWAVNERPRNSKFADNVGDYYQNMNSAGD